MDERAWWNLHPAEVVFPSGIFAGATQVTMTTTPEDTHRLHVYEYLPQTGIVEIADLEADSWLLNTNQGSKSWVETPGGRVLVGKGRGCGCYSPLKAHRPFGAIRTLARR